MLCFDTLCFEGPWTRGSFLPRVFVLASHVLGSPKAFVLFLETLWGAGFGRAASFAGDSHWRPGPKVGGKPPLASFLGSGAVNLADSSGLCQRPGTSRLGWSGVINF